MKAPETTNPAFFAPCGMNCMVCYKHLGKKPCPGCLSDDPGRPGRCRRCKIKACTSAKGLACCFRCADFPCGQLRKLDKSYRTRYGANLLQNSRIAKEKGIAFFLAQQMEKYTCPDCGGIISLHDGDCSGCGKPYPLGRRSVTG